MDWRTTLLAALGACGLFAVFNNVMGSHPFAMEAMTALGLVLFSISFYFYDDKYFKYRGYVAFVKFVAILSILHLVTIFSVFSFEDYMSNDKLIHSVEYKNLLYMVLNFVVFVFSMRFLLKRETRREDEAEDFLTSELRRLRDFLPDATWEMTGQGYRGKVASLGEVELIYGGAERGWQIESGDTAVDGCLTAVSAVVALSQARAATRSVRI